MYPEQLIFLNYRSVVNDRYDSHYPIGYTWDDNDRIWEKQKKYDISFEDVVELEQYEERD